MRSEFTTLAAFSILLAASPAAVAPHQQRCTQSIANLPAAHELHGFRLGMSADELKKRLPQFEIAKADSTGLSKASFNPEFASAEEASRFPGVRTLSFEFLDDKLFSVGIAWNRSFAWQTTDDALAGLAKSLGLNGEWQSRSWRGIEMVCADLSVTVRMIGGSPSFTLVDTAAKERLEKRIESEPEPTPTPSPASSP